MSVETLLFQGGASAQEEGELIENETRIGETEKEIFTMLCLDRVP